MQINKETIEQLFRQHYLRMYQLARVLLKDDAASKDVVSEVFADVLDGKTQFSSANVGSYLLVCVRHKCLNLLSRQKMKDRVHHLLKADASPSIGSPGSDACRNRQGDRQVRGNSGLYRCRTHATNPQGARSPLSAKAEISGDCYGIGHQRSGSL